MQQTARSNFTVVSAAVALALGLYAYPLLLDIPLIDPDEGRHAVMAQQMVEQADWVTPRYMDQVFFDKPALFFWAQAGSLKLFGMSQEAVRLPGMLFGLLGNLTTVLFGWRLFGRRAGILAGFIHATLALPLALVQAAVHDVALVPWVMLALLSFWESAQAATSGRRLALAALAGVWLGLAVLTKGLIGVAIVGVVHALYLHNSQKLNWRAVASGALALTVAAAVASPWFIMMSLRNPGYFYNYFVERHVFGYMTTGQPHGGAPWWYYLPILAVGGLPWVTSLPAAWTMWREGRASAVADPAQQNLTFVWLYFLGGLAFLSAGHSKLATYLLPVIPAVALLVATLWDRLLDGRTSDAVRIAMGRMMTRGCSLLPVVLPVLILVLSKVYKIQTSAVFWGVTIGFSMACLLPVLNWKRGRPGASLAVVIVLVAVGFDLVMTGIAPKIVPQFSGRDLAVYLNRTRVIPPEMLVLNQRVDSVIFYLDPPLRRQIRNGQIHKLTHDEMPTIDSMNGAVQLALPERKMHKLHERARLTDVPFVQSGVFRIYTAADLQAKTALAPSTALQR